MEKNSECNSVHNNLFFQSYTDAFHKSTENTETFEDFEVPSDIVEKRKKGWEDLFAKYLSNKSTVELDLRTLKPVKLHKNAVESVQKCLPMRKSMSMVQYWVDTGNQPYTENYINKSHSDSGSSLIEEELDEMISCEKENSSLEKHLEIPVNKHFNVARSSSSSVDTAAYILANNNTTKKADTIAIVEGSKTIDTGQTQTNQSFKFTDDIDHVNKSIEDSHKTRKKDIFEKSIINKTNNSQLDNLSNSDLEDINLNKNLKLEWKKNNTNVIVNKKTISTSEVDENLKNMNINQQLLIDEKSEKEMKNSQLLLTSESDESIFKSKYEDLLVENSQRNHSKKFQSFSLCNEQTKGQTSKLLKRKKLYNNTDSTAEFTPISEDNISYHTLKVSFKKCEHPALETPKISKLTNFIKSRRLHRRSKKNENQSLLFPLSKLKFKQMHKLSDTDGDDEISNFSNKSENENDARTKINSEVKVYKNVDKCIKNNFKQTIDRTIDQTNYENSLNNDSNSVCSEDSAIKLYDKKNKISRFGNTLNDQFKLKPLTVILYRLPYKYEKENSKTNSLQTDAQRIDYSKQRKENSEKCIANQQIPIYNQKLNSFHNDASEKSYITSSDDDNDIINLIDDLFSNVTKNKHTIETSVKNSNGETNNSISISNKTNVNNINAEKDSINKAESIHLKINLQAVENIQSSVTSKLYKTTVSNSKNNSTLRQSSKYMLVTSSSDESDLNLDVKSNLRNKFSNQKIDNDEKSLKSNEYSSKYLLSNSSSQSELSSNKLTNTKLCKTVKLTKINRKRKCENSNTNKFNKKSLLINNPKTICNLDEKFSSNKKESCYDSRQKTCKNDNTIFSESENSNPSNDSENEKLLFNKKDLQLSEYVESNLIENCTKVHKINSNENLLMLNNVQDEKNQSIDKLSTNIHSNSNRKSIYKKSLESSDEDSLVQAEEKNKCMKIEENGLSKRHSENLNCNNLNQVSKNVSNKDKSKEKLLTMKSNKKTSEILILSDEECIIPLKINSTNNKENYKNLSQTNNKNLQIQNIMDIFYPM